MKVLRIILVLVGLLALIIIGVGLFGPTEINVSHTKTMEADKASVFNQVADFKNWENWSPWAEMDTAMVMTYGETSTGVGGSYSWDGPIAMKGSMEMREVIPGEKLGMDIGFDMGDGKQWSTCDMTFAENNGKTDVTWNFNSTDGTGFMDRIMNVFMPSMLRGQYEKGLSNLDKVALANPYVEKKQPARKKGIEKKDMDGFYYLGVRYSDVKIQDITAEMYGNAYGAIMQSLGENATKIVQPPIALTESFDPETSVSTFVVAMMTTEQMPASEGLISDYHKSSTAMVTTHYGPYENLPGTYEKVMGAIAEKGLTPLYPAYEMYMNDPESLGGDMSKLETQLVVPIEWK